jgi:hypothetical protein
MLSQRCLKEGFAEALEHFKEKRKCKFLIMTIQPEPSQPLFSSPLLLRLKKGKWIFGCAVFMGVS